eukprot:6366857-Pyramimonas_sp.AAC.1
MAPPMFAPPRVHYTYCIAVSDASRILHRIGCTTQVAPFSAPYMLYQYVAPHAARHEFRHTDCAN